MSAVGTTEAAASGDLGVGGEGAVPTNPDPVLADHVFGDLFHEGDDDGPSGGLNGACCSDGDCVCRGPAPIELTGDDGEYRVGNYGTNKGAVFYPTDAEPPFSAIALCGGFTNVGYEMRDWGRFFASHGIVTLITDTGALDQPGTRGRKLSESIQKLKEENENSSSPLYQQLNGRYGTAGYSMGGGGTTRAAQDDPSLKTSLALAAWSPEGLGVRVPTLYLCGGSDLLAGCDQGGYNWMPNDVPKMIVRIDGVGHLSWFGPRDAGWGTSGGYALAFQKVYLEGDERWKDLLLEDPALGDILQTNIQ